MNEYDSNGVHYTYNKSKLPSKFNFTKKGKRRKNWQPKPFFVK